MYPYPAARDVAGSPYKSFGASVNGPIAISATLNLPIIWFNGSPAEYGTIGGFTPLAGHRIHCVGSGNFSLYWISSGTSAGGHIDILGSETPSFATDFAVAIIPFSASSTTHLSSNQLNTLAFTLGGAGAIAPAAGGVFKSPFPYNRVRWVNGASAQTEAAYLMVRGGHFQ